MHIKDPERISRYTWWLIGILSLAMFVSYLDRQIIALVVEPMKKDLGFSDTQLGWLYGAFALFYAAASIPIAWLTDNTKRMRLIRLGVFFWSVATVSCGFFKNFWLILAARVGVGVGEATLTPCTYSIFGDVLPRSRLPMAFSLFQVGAIVGSGVAFVLGGAVLSWVRYKPPVELPFIGELFSWQLIFFYVGLPGLLLLLLLGTLTEPLRKKTKQIEGESRVSGWGQVVQFYRENWRTIIPHHLGASSLILVGYSFIFWSPSFFERVHGLPVEKASIIFGLIFVVAGTAGCVLAAFLSRWMFDQGYRHAGFSIPAASGFLVLPVIVLIQLAPNLYWVLILYVPALFLINVPFGLLHGALSQICPPEIQGRVACVYLITTAIGNLVGPPIVGALNDYVFQNADGVRYSQIAVCIVFGLLGAGLLWLGRRQFVKSIDLVESRESLANMP